MTTRRAFCTMAATALATATAARADHYPSKPITWIVPYTPGGITDQTSRIVSKRLGELLGQVFVLDNRPGAGGSLGTEIAARAAPDGYTVIYVSATTMAANVALYKNLKYDPLRDFIPLHALFQSPTILVTEQSRPYRTVADVVAAAKARPGEVNYGSAGAGSATHLSAEWFQETSGTRLSHVPYKGSAPALQDMLGGRLDLMFDYMSTIGPQIKAGKLRPLAVLNKERLKALPDVPTINEAGLPGTMAVPWSGLAVPTGTPPDVVKKLADAIEVALRDPQVVNTFIDNGSTPMVGLKLDAFRTFIAEEQKRWGDLVRKSGATVS